jgi:DNA-binding MarR family transcriptional regulator
MDADMKKLKQTPATDAVTALILSVFRFNNALLRAGDQLVASLGLTSARWQVLGAIVYAERPQPVAWLARDLGANRQNVQRIVNDLEAAGLVGFETNPHHRRAQLVVLTEKGREVFAAAMHLQVPWAERLCADIPVKDIEAAHQVVTMLQRRLDQDENGDEVSPPERSARRPPAK